MGSRVRVNMRNKWSWSRPAAHIYSYNTDPTTFKTGYSYSSSSSGERSARASSVAVGSESGLSRASRDVTVAPAASDLSCYSGYYGKQLAKHSDKAAVSSTVATTTAVNTAVTEQTSKSVEATERTSKKMDFMKEHSQSLEYGKSSRSQALRRAEMHAEKSGRDPRHVMVPRNLEDDICKKVADIHMYENNTKSQQGRLKVEKMEKELAALINSSMSYKSVYSKTAKQMAMEAMQACESEAAASSKKIRKTVVETASKRAVVA